MSQVHAQRELKRIAAGRTHAMQLLVYFATCSERRV